MSSALEQSQISMTAHLRNPEKNPAPLGIEDRRLNIYRELIYNNVEGFISGGFPILRQLTADEHWHAMVRDFIECHESHSPYFLEISQEFLTYLQEERGDLEGDPVFLKALAHYEWVELALDVADAPLPEGLRREGDLLEDYPFVSPYAWSLSYDFPVHMIGANFQPQAPSDEATFLVVYRNQSDEVKFMESNAVTARVLQLLAATPPMTGSEVMYCIAEELQHPDPKALQEMGRELLQTLFAESIIAGFVEP